MKKDGQNKHMIDQLMCKVWLKCVCICLLMIFNAWLKARLMKPCPRSIYSDVSQFRSRLLEKTSQAAKLTALNDAKWILKLPHSQDRWWVDSSLDEVTSLPIESTCHTSESSNNIQRLTWKICSMQRCGWSLDSIDWPRLGSPDAHLLRKGKSPNSRCLNWILHMV